MPNIEYVKMGFSTNSSSSHSIVWGPWFKNYVSAENLAQGRYESDLFRCVTPNAKSLYLMHLVYDRLVEKLGTQMTMHLMQGMFPALWQVVSEAALQLGAEDRTTAKAYLEKGYVDDTSILDASKYLDFPRYFWDPDEIQIPIATDFIQEAVNAMVDDDRIAIIGGADDVDPQETYSDEEMKIINAKRGSPFAQIFSARGFRVKPHGDGCWSIYSLDNGTKMRINLADMLDPEPDFVPASPDLVDLKITNKCLRDCSFCYQDSTSEGSHASLSTLRRLARVFNGQKVFEVAIGGGEPTLHPSFADIIETFAENGIATSFSTASLDWLDSLENIDAVRKHVRAIGYSTQSPKEAGCAIEMLHRVMPDVEVYIHYVMGVSPVVNLMEMFEVIPGETIVLLGYKPCGRAQASPPFDYSNWLDIVDHAMTRGRFGHTHVSVDTCLAAQTPELNTRVPNVLFDTEDGRYSMYIDAVQGTTAASSYCQDTIEPFDDVQEVFKSFPYL